MTMDESAPAETDPTATAPEAPGELIPPGTLRATGGPGEPGMPAALRIAAIASLGAGAVHATAAGSHSEHRAAVVAFTATAILQIGWGVLAFARRGRLVALAGVAVNAGALAGWLLAKTSGIGFVEGLDVKESAQFADSLAAGLAAVAVVGAALALAERLSWAARPHPALVGAAAAATVALLVPGMVTTGSHEHAGGHGDEVAGHDNGDGADGEGHGDGAVPAMAKPYDATLPVDLGGVPGVSAEAQRQAEELVTITLQKLPQFADPDYAYSLGYRSIRDGVTGFEHFMKWDLVEDGRVLDP
ncbi:MAG TPA: hypothetical protein VF015_00530, partial [Acidimicrobiales bacterium]